MNWLRKAAARVYDGTFQIGWRIGRWPWQDRDRRERAVRAVLLLAGLAVAGWVSQAHPRVAEIAMVVWVVAAFRAGEGEDDAEQAEAEELPPPALRTPDETLLLLVVRLIGDGPGIHLDTLLTVMQSQPRWAALERDDLRALLGAVDCPVRRTLRVGTRTGTAGVHRDDAHQALLRHRAANPSPALVDTPADDM